MKDEKFFRYLEARKRVTRLRVFYLHVILYLIAFGLIIWNLIIIEDTPYTNSILALNYSVIFVWGFFVVLNAIYVFRWKTIFNKKWEEKQLQNYLNDESSHWE